MVLSRKKLKQKLKAASESTQAAGPAPASHLVSEAVKRRKELYLEGNEDDSFSMVNKRTKKMKTKTEVERSDSGAIKRDYEEYAQPSAMETEPVSQKVKKKMKRRKKEVSRNTESRNFCHVVGSHGKKRNEHGGTNEVETELYAGEPGNTGTGKGEIIGKKKKKRWKKGHRGSEENGRHAVKQSYVTKEEEAVEGDENLDKYDGNTVTDNLKLSQASETFPTKVYVGGIPYYSTEDDIMSFFENCGTITNVDCMKFQESGKFRGIAIITFKTEAAAKRAVALDGADMGGLFLKIQPYKMIRAHERSSDFSPEMIEGYNRLYVGNLSWDVNEDDLRNLFSSCRILSIRFGVDKLTGEFRGYAHVDFCDRASLLSALKLDQKVVRGRPVRIRCALARKNASNDVERSVKLQVRKDGEKSSGKKRRTCYTCGVAGHLSSSCPNMQFVKKVV